VREDARREVLERIAVREHKRAEPLRVVDRDDLAERAARVVADEHDVVQVQRLQEAGDDRRDAPRGDVRACAHRLRVGAERPRRHQYAQPMLGQPGAELRPEVAGHQVAVDAHDRPAVGRPRLLVVDRALREFYCRHVGLLRIG
jgi:hypothetical protein